MNSIAQKRFPLVRLGLTRLRLQSGMTLVEVMIALTLGLILVAGITTLIAQQSGTRTDMEKATRQIENGRYAIQLLQEDIQQAGYYGDFFPPIPGIDKKVTLTQTTPADLCAVLPAVMGWGTSPLQMPTALFGLPEDPTNTNTPTCVTDRKTDTDIIVVRRVATQPVTIPVAGESYLQVSACATEMGTTSFVFGTPPTTSFTLRKKDCIATNPSNIYKYMTRIYYVSTCNVCGTDTIPTLKYVELINGQMNIVPLVEGIQDLQLDYGLDTPIVDGSPDSYSAAPAAAEWANVLTVQVNLLARSNEVTQGYVNDKSYNLGSAGVVGPFNDGFKRQVFTRLVRAINPSGRSEK